MAAQQLARGLKAAYAGHFHVHQNHIRFQLAGLLQRLFARIGLTDNLQATDIGQHPCDSGTYQIVVIDHQYPNQATPHSTA